MGDTSTFDPDEFMAKKATPPAATSAFDPDAFMSAKPTAGPGRGSAVAAPAAPVKSHGFFDPVDPKLIDVNAPDALMPRPDNPYGKATIDPIISGVSDIKNGEYSRGAHKVVTGVGTGLAPFALPFAAAAPVAAATSAGLGYAGGKLVRGAASLFDLSPDQQDLAEDVGNVAGGSFGPKVAGAVFNPTSRFNPLRSNPTFATGRAIGEVSNAPETIATIKATNGRDFKPSMSADGKLNVIPAAQKAANIYGDALEPWFARIEGQRRPGTPIIDATHEGINQLLPSEQDTARRPFTPTGKSLLERAKQDYAEFTPRELADRLELLNRRLSPFYNKSDAAQSTILADVPEAVLKNQRDAAANMLYEWMDPENGGAGPREIQAKRGDMLEFMNAAKRREPAIAAQQPLSFFGKMMDPLRSAFHGMLPGGKVFNLAAPHAEGSQGRSLPLLRKSFKAVDPTEAINDLGAIPRPGPRVIAAPSDDSGPVGPTATAFKNVDAVNPNGRKMLNPSNAMTYGHEGKGGVLVPDIIASSSRGEGTPHRLITAADPNKPTPTVLPRNTVVVNPQGSPGIRADFVDNEDLLTKGFHDPRESEILAGSGAAGKSWLPAAAGTPAQDLRPAVISKRGEPVVNGPNVVDRKPTHDLTPEELARAKQINRVVRNK